MSQKYPCTAHLAQSENSLLGPNNTAFQHDKVIGHFTVMNKPALNNENSKSIYKTAFNTKMSLNNSAISQQQRQTTLPEVEFTAENQPGESA